MKKSAQAVIIGGGIIGCAAAYYLAKEIDDVILIEKKCIAGESSGANYGMVWQQTRQDGYDLAAARRSLEIYPQLCREVFDLDIEYEEKGGMTLFFTDLQAEAAKGYVEYKNSLGVPVRLLSGKETRSLEPALSSRVTGSLFCAEEAQLNPFYTTLAFARAAQKEGATIYQGVEVLSINLDRGAVCSISTSEGKIFTNHVINAAGSWAGTVGAMVGLKVPVFPHRLQSLVTEQIPKLLTRTIQGSRIARTSEEAAKTFQYAYDTTGGNRPCINQQPPAECIIESSLFYAKPTVNANIVLGTACDFAGYNRETSYEALAVIAHMAKMIIPRLKDVNIIRSWANFDPWTADGIPIVGETGVKGFFIAAGHGTGMSHAPATGEALAGLITGSAAAIPLGEANINRFTGYREEC